MNYSIESQKADEFFRKCQSILTSKANDYACEDDVFSNFKTAALICKVPVDKIFLMALTIKIVRVSELLEKTNKNESLEDSLMDLANYACLMALYRKDSQ